jgi:hypothetical protein
MESQYPPMISYSVVDNKIYDVSKSIFIADMEDGRYSLYKTGKGNYFGTINSTAKIFINLLVWGDVYLKENLQPLSREEAIEFLNKFKLYEIIKKEFPELEEA